MLKRSLFTMIASLGLLIPLSEVTAEPSKASESIEMAKTWQSLNITRPGVHVHNDTVYVMVSRPWDLSTSSKHRRWATPLIGYQLYQWAANQQKLSSVESRLLSTSNGTLQVSNGRSIFSGKKGENFQMVYAFNLKEVLNQSKKINFKSQARQIAENALKKPTDALVVFEEFGFPEIALLIALKRYYGKLYSVSAPITKLRAFTEVSRSYYEARDALIQIASPKIRNTDLYNLTWNCVDQPTDFHAQLAKAHVKLLATETKGPIMFQIKACQGFVVFDQNLSDKMPEMMPRIKKLFAQGKDLDLATYLLERAVEESPRNVEVWEYLTAAYEAGQKKESADLAARVWFLLDKSDSKEPFYKVFVQRREKDSEQYQYFLQLIK